MRYKVHGRESMLALGTRQRLQYVRGDRARVAREAAVRAEDTEEGGVDLRRSSVPVHRIASSFRTDGTGAARRASKARAAGQARDCAPGQATRRPGRSLRDRHRPGRARSECRSPRRPGAHQSYKSRGCYGRIAHQIVPAGCFGFGETQQLASSSRRIEPDPAMQGPQQNPHHSCEYPEGPESFMP